MNRTGPGPQPLRVMTGNTFQAQQSAANRSAPLGSGRLQNGKIGTGSGWGFGVPMGGAPGLSLSSAQSRTNNGIPSSFAQSSGSSQSYAPLDLTEFPSLSGNPQSQQQSMPSQAIWSNPSLRATQPASTQHMSVQRAQGQTAVSQVNSSPHPQSHPQQPSSQAHEENAPNHSHFAGQVDDFRYNGQAGVGQLSGSHRPQTGNIDEFPPLGAGNGDMGHDRRTSMIQTAAYGGNDVHPSRSLVPGVGDRAMGPIGMQNGVSRNTLDTLRGSQPMAEVDRSGAPRILRGLTNPSFPSHQPNQLPFRGGGFQDPSQQPIGQSTQVSQQDQAFQPDVVDSPQSAQTNRPQANHLSELDRFGLPGLLSLFPGENHEPSNLAIGHDLTTLGLDLNRPDGSPLYPTFGSPFSDPNARPIVPDFNLPAAYTVTNVPPLHSKISSFSDDTLFNIFYQHPRDILQEIAASELCSRDWRWHKELRQWMMKDNQMPPFRVSDKQERGYYIFFDVANWRRERREFLLNYEHLDYRHVPAQPAAAV